MNTSTAQNNTAQNSEFVFFRPRPDGNIDPAGEAGWFMQRQREEAGVSLEQISQAINIHPYHLAAIEHGDLTGLPSRSEALDMIGTYATLLGFDAKPLVDHFTRFLPQTPIPAAHRIPSKRDKKRPAPLSSAKILRFPLMEKMRSLTAGAGGVVASCLGAVMLFGLASWAFIPGDETVSGSNAPVLAQSDNTKVDQVASISTITEQPMPDTTTKAASDADKSASSLSGLDQLIAKNIADPNLQTASVSTRKKAPVETVGESKTNPSGGQVYGTENKNARLVLHANSNVWVRIEDAKGNVVMTRTMMAGDSYQVPARNGLVVIARDGGLLSYKLDGTNKGNLGRKGEILVGRSLDLEKLASNS